MGTKFGGHYPVISRRDDKERLMFIAAAGVLFALTTIMVVVLNFKEPASATQDKDRAAAPAITESMGTVALLAPARYVRAGTKLSDIEFKQVFWPRNQVPEEAILDRAEVRDFYASRDLTPDVPLQRAFLSKQPANISLPLTPGNRAISIQVDDISGLEGHALPGTRVDVVLTYTDQGNLTSKVLVQNARVLSYGGEMRIDASVPRERRATAKTITLDVVPDDALKISTARELGRLSLMMRAADDDTGLHTLDMNKFDIEGGAAKAKQKEKDFCKKGNVKMGGKEYIVGCSGNIEQLDPNQEP